MGYDRLAELIVAAPGRRAPLSALKSLRQAAQDGDFDAVVMFCRVLAHELGHDPGTAGLTGVRSLEELVGARDVASLIRLYALGYLPRAIVIDLAAWQPLAAAVHSEPELVPF